MDDVSVVIFDCRFALSDVTVGEQSWKDAHIPCARYAHLDRDLSGPHTPGAGRHPWPASTTFTAWLGRNGVTPDVQVVAYDAGDGAFASRLWCMLRMLGHRKVAVLDGGWARWTALGLPTTADVAQVVAGEYPQTPFEHARLLDAAAVQQHLHKQGVLIDARGAERFRGDVEPIDRVAGHVTGAVNRPYALNLHDGQFKHADQLAEEFRPLLDGRAGNDVVVMCGSGVTACHHLLALSHAGLGEAKLFTGSWSGWIEDSSRPIATGAD